jgi:hypothetical protein
MRPLLDFLRWKLFDFLMRYFPTEQPSENEYIAYLKDKQRHSEPDLPVAFIEPTHVQLPERLDLPTGVWRRHYFIEQRPDLYKPPVTHPRVRKTVRLEPLRDESWLSHERDTDPFHISERDMVPVEHETDPTVKVEAVKMQSLHKQKES